MCVCVCVCVCVCSSGFDVSICYTSFDIPAWLKVRLRVIYGLIVTTLMNN